MITIRPSYNWILPNCLAVGDHQAGTDLTLLKALNINILVCAEEKLPFRASHYRASGLDGIIHIPLYDNEHDEYDSDLMEHMFQMVDKAIKEHKRVMFHCAKGLSRSVFLAAWYLLKSNQCQYVEDTIQWIRKKRSCIQPNKQFLEWLHDMFDLE